MQRALKDCKSWPSFGDGAYVSDKRQYNAGKYESATVVYCY